MGRIIENEALNGLNSYTLTEMMSDLNNGIWSELKNGKFIDIYRRNLQKSYISRVGLQNRYWRGSGRKLHCRQL